MRQKLPTLFLVMTLLGAGTAGAKDYSYKTKEGCGITRYAKAWVKSNVTSMSWTGECNKNKRAKGNGTLTVTLTDGRVETYTGEMRGGRFAGQGEYKPRNGRRWVGEFIDGWFSRGQIYDADGRLMYDGALYLYTDEYHIGKLYYPDGGYVDATFLKGAVHYNRATGEGIDNGVVYDASDAKLGWWVRGQFLRDENAYFDTLNRTYAADSARWQAEAEAAERKRQQEESAAWTQLGAALGAGVTAYGGQQQQLEAMNKVLLAPPPKAGGGFTEGLIAGASGGFGGRAVAPGTGGSSPTSARVYEVTRGPVAFDPASTSSDESRCVRVIVEDTGKMVNAGGEMTPEVWVLLVNDCGYDIEAFYCFEINQHGYSCATAYPGNGPREDGTIVALADRGKRVNARFNGHIDYLLNPNQKVYLGACRYELKSPGSWQSGSHVRGRHSYTSGGGFQFGCHRGR